MRILFFDTETTGTPKKYKAPMTELDNWPRVIQLAFQVADLESGDVLFDAKHLIKPDGWVIPREKFWIDNGFSTEENEAKGVPMAQVLEEFIWWIEAEEIRTMVAHNIAFDYPILGAEMIRYDKRAGWKLDQICTMTTTVDLCKVPYPSGRGGYKWPKLEELHQTLFGRGFAGAHDAGNDVTACRHCFFELINRGHIKIPA